MTNVENINVIDDKKIVFLINCSLKDKYAERYSQLYEKLQNFKYDYLFLISKKGSNGIKNNTLYVDLDDIYENLSKKIYEGVKYIYHNTEYNYIYKVDDDFFDMTLNITNDVYCDYYGNYIITELNRIYHFGKCHDAELNKLKYEGKFLRNYAAGGYGYVLSRKSMFYIINNKDYIYSEIYEDKAIGDVLCKNNIKLTCSTQNVIKHRNNKVKINLSTNYKCAVIMFHKNIKKSMIGDGLKKV